MKISKRAPIDTNLIIQAKQDWQRWGKAIGKEFCFYVWPLSIPSVLARLNAVEYGRPGRDSWLLQTTESHLQGMGRTGKEQQAAANKVQERVFACKDSTMLEW